MDSRGAPWATLLSVLLCLGVGCDSSSAGAPDGGGLCAGWPEPGVAFPPNFNGFHSWASAPAGGPDGSTDGLHGVGPLRVYYNAAPPHAATAFPQCTIIVKETEEVDATQRTVFAMVKRGDDYNSAGAVGWEWFSLLNDGDGGVAVLWRTTPLATDVYAQQPIGDCNGCHEAARKNDYVWDTPLELGNF